MPSSRFLSNNRSASRQSNYTVHGLLSTADNGITANWSGNPLLLQYRKSQITAKNAADSISSLIFHQTTKNHTRCYASTSVFTYVAAGGPHFEANVLHDVLIIGRQILQNRRDFPGVIMKAVAPCHLPTVIKREVWLERQVGPWQRLIKRSQRWRRETDRFITRCGRRLVHTDTASQDTG
jgi:hypothetical protein